MIGSQSGGLDEKADCYGILMVDLLSVIGPPASR
jgi:hypothetical protein